jgi:hypothetical protein
VRAIAGDKNAGFALNATGDTTVEYAFDLTTLPDDVIKTLAAEMVKRRAGETTRGVAAGNYRAEGHPMTEINPSTLSVVAFVQAANREVLQAAHTDVAANTSKAGKGGK